MKPVDARRYDAFCNAGTTRTGFTFPIMGEQYTHLLIATPCDFVPIPQSVENFLQKIVEFGVVSTPAKLVGTRSTGQIRKIALPPGFNAAGDEFSHEVRTRFDIAGLDDIAPAISALPDYEVAVEGIGRPVLPPLPIKFSEPYSIRVFVRVSAELRSTSDPHWNFGETPKAVPYGKPCSRESDRGFYVNPHTGADIEIQGAGCAKFWIGFELGKFLFPSISDGNLDLVDRGILDFAENLFETRFVQGCYWG